MMPSAFASSGAGVAGELDAVLRQAGERAGVPADQRRARVFQRAGERKSLAVGDRLDQRAAHPPAGAGDHQPHVGHGSSPEFAGGYSAAAGKRHYGCGPS